MTDEETPEEVESEEAQPTSRKWKLIRRSALAAFALLVVYYLSCLWIVHSTGNTDQARPVDAIVVLGAAQYDGRPSPLLAARLDHVAELWAQGLAEMVITTGGKQPGDRFTEAESSKNYLIDRGVPANVIVQVGGSNSYESLREVRDEVRRRDGESVLLVTDPYHSLRVRMISQELGLTAYVSPTQTSPVGDTTRFLRELREAAGVAVGRIIGFDSLLFLTG